MLILSAGNVLFNQSFNKKCDVIITAGTMVKHTKKFCENRRILCPQRCAQLIIVKTLEIHMKTQCVCRPDFCVFCSSQLLFKDKSNHEKTCNLRGEPCPAKCGEMVRLAYIKQHLMEVTYLVADYDLY